MIDELIPAVSEVYKKNKKNINKILFYTLAAVVIYSSELFDYLPKYYGVILSILLTLIFFSINNFFTARKKHLNVKNREARLRKNNRNFAIQQSILISLILLLFLFNHYNVFMDRGKKLIIDYYDCLNHKILNKENVAEKVNLRMFKFLDETHQDSFSFNFPNHDIKSDFYELWGNTVKYKILDIEQFQQTHYIALVEVSEYIMKNSLPKGDSLTNDQKVKLIIAELKKYFVFNSEAEKLKNMDESEIEKRIRYYLLNGEDQDQNPNPNQKSLLEQDLGDISLWGIGARFKLKLQVKKNIRTTCEDNLCKYIEIKYFSPHVDKGTLTFWKLGRLKPTPI